MNYPTPFLAVAFSETTGVVLAVLSTPVVVLFQRWLVVRNCRSDNPPRHSFEILWAIALFTAIFFFGFQQQSDVSIFSSVLAFVIVMFMVAAAAVDLTEFRLPDVIVLPVWFASIVAIGIAALIEKDAIPLLGALVASGTAFFLLLIAHLISPRGMGFGDVKAVGVLTLPIGWLAGSVEAALVATLWMLFASFAIGSIIGGVLWLKDRKSSPLPFGPALLAGAIVVLTAQFIGG